MYTPSMFVLATVTGKNYANRGEQRSDTYNFYYSAAYSMNVSVRFTISEVAVDGKSQWCCSAQTAAIQLHVLTYNWTRVMQLANTTAPINHTRPSPHEHSSDGATRARSKHPITPYYSVYRPRKDERLNWPSWLTCSGRFTHISGHPSAARQGRFAGQRPIRTTTVPRAHAPPT